MLLETRFSDTHPVIIVEKFASAANYGVSVTDFNSLFLCICESIDSVLHYCLGWMLMLMGFSIM